MKDKDLLQEAIKGKKLLQETYSVQLQLNEGNEGGMIIASGQFGKCDIPTANGRVYPTALWERELGKLLPRMHENEVYGELDHPGDGSTKLARVSHLIIGAEISEDGLILGKAKIMPNTRNGKQLLAILKDGGKVGISSRGFGSVEQNEEGNDVVQDDFTLMTWDFVADPAASGSYPDFKSESDNGKVTPKIKLKESNKDDDMAKKIKSDSKTEGFKPSENIKEQDGEDKDKEKEDEKKDESLSADPVGERMENLVAKIRKEESEKATAKIDEMMKLREEEVRESIKSELASDPAIAGAKLALEAVKTHLRPYILGEDISEELGARDTQIEGLQSDVSAKDEQLQEYAAVTKELGFKLRVEQQIADFPNKKDIRHRVGDVTRFESLKQLDVKLEKVLSALKEREDQYNESVKLKNSEIESLKKEVTEQKQLTQDALKVAENFGIKAYVEKVTAGTGASTKIKKIVESRGITKAEDVDAIVEQFKSLKTPGSTMMKKIQSRIKKTENTSTLVEDQIKDTFPKEDLSEELIPGIKMADIKRLS